MTAFSKLLVANFKQFFRDRVALFFTFAFPLLFMLIFGLVFGGSDDIKYKIGLVNNDNSAVSTVVTKVLHEVPVFEIKEGELSSSLTELRKGNLRAVVVIPANLESTIATGNTVDITVHYDPAHTSSAQIIIPVLKEVLNEINQQLTQQPTILELTEESTQSQNLRNIDYMVPGILSMSILFLGLFGGLPLVEWREKQVLKRFGATPLRRSTVLSTQIAYRLVLAILQTLIIIIIAYFVFDVQIVGSWLLLLGLVLIGTLTFVSLGYLAVSRARTTEGAMPIIQLIQFPMLFLSGIFFPIEFMPDFMRPVVTAMPLTYLGDALRQVMVNATPLYSMSINIAVLTGWLVVSAILSIKLFRWE